MTGPGNGSVRSGLTGTGIALGVLSAGTFGTSGIAGSALIGSGWSPAAAAVARLGGAAVLLAAPALLQVRGRWTLLRQGAGKVTIYGLIAIGGGQLFYFNAIEYMPIGIALVFEYLGVVLVVGWLWASGAQRPRWLTVAGMVAVIAGLALLVDLPGSSRIRPVGIVWGLLEAVSLAIYFLLSAAGREEETLPPLVMAWSGLSVGAAFLAAAGGLGTVACRRGDRLHGRHCRRPASRRQASLADRHRRGFFRGALRVAAARPETFPHGVHRRRVHPRRRHPGTR